MYFEVLYEDVPGIPKGPNNYTEYPYQQLMDNKIPDKVSFYDMCKKPTQEDKNEVIELTIWPEGVDVPP